MAYQSKKRKSVQINVQDFIEKWLPLIDLDADYQREEIWPPWKKARLINSLVQDIDIPKIYLAETKDDVYECIDGKQRITAIVEFFKPSYFGDDFSPRRPLKVKLTEEKDAPEFSYRELEQKENKLAKFITDEYKLDFSILVKPDDKLIRETFARLQLGDPLKSGESLPSMTGDLRDFIFKVKGRDMLFFRHTKLSFKRFSREFALAQMVLNSFSKRISGEFRRARYEDIANDFEQYKKIGADSKSIKHVEAVLEVMDKEFGKDAELISSRAVAVSAYLFVEELINEGRRNDVSKFVQFYLRLIREIKNQMKLLRDFKAPTNKAVLDYFHKYVLQASVEKPSVTKRHEFLLKSFGKYKKTGEVISDELAKTLFKND